MLSSSVIDVKNRLKSYFAPKPQVSARDIFRELPKSTATVGKAIGNFGKQVGQGLVREGASLATGVASQPVGGSNTSLKERFRILTQSQVYPAGKLSQALTGRTTPFSLGTEGSETLQGFGVNPQSAMKYGPLVGLGLAATDFVPGKKQVVQKVAKEGVEAGAFKGFKDLSTKILEKLRGKLVTSKQEILDFTNMGDIKQAERDLIRRTVEEMSPTNPLAQEARKYKSAEEFVKNFEQGAKNIESLRQKSKITVPSAKSVFGEDILRTLDDQRKFSNFNELPDEIAGLKIDKVSLQTAIDHIKFGRLPKDANKPITIFNDVSTGNKSILDGYHRLVQAMKSGGKDLDTRVLYGDNKGREFLTLKKSGFNTFPHGKTEFIDTKSQLTDIWNKAGKESIPVQEFANKVKTELLPLNYQSSLKGEPRYENIALSDDLRGPVAQYEERVYESPIKTSAGKVHFGDELNDNYFAHTRIEDLPPTGVKDSIAGNMGDISNEYARDLAKYAKQGSTRRVIEIQSDLFQKGRLEGELNVYNSPLSQAEIKRTSYLQSRIRDLSSENNINRTKDIKEVPELQSELDRLIAKNEKLITEQKGIRAKEIAPLEPYRNTWHERVIREEVKQAAVDGKTKLQFPTGETAMKIEGLGDTQQWRFRPNPADDSIDRALTNTDLQVGREVAQPGGDSWIITDVLEDGKFKAVPQERYEQLKELTNKDFGKNASDDFTKRQIDAQIQSASETFDISGKVDTNNPIYKFYEKEVGKYLRNRYGAQLVTDAQGVKWWELPVKKDYARLPVEAFAGLPFIFNKNESNDSR